MKKIILTAMTLVCINISSTIAYNKTAKDTQLLSTLETTIQRIDNQKLMTINIRIDTILPRLNEDSRAFFIVSELQNIIIQVLSERQSDQTDQILEEIFSEELPDFYIKSIKLEENSSRAGGIVILTEYCNQGNVSVPAIRYHTRHSYDNQTDAGTTAHEHVIEPGKCRNHKFTPLAHSIPNNTSHTFTVVIDSENTIEEANESNNSITKEFFISYPTAENVCPEYKYVTCGEDIIRRNIDQNGCQYPSCVYQTTCPTYLAKRGRKIEDETEPVVICPSGSIERTTAVDQCERPICSQ